jgi:hypothetical protein
MNAMKSRADKLDRIASLMKLQLRLAEWELARLRQREQELTEEQTYLVGALNEARPPAGSSSESIARRLTTASIGARTARARASMQLYQVHAEGRRVKQIERVAKTAALDRSRDAERRSLEEIAAAHVRLHDWKSSKSECDHK